MMSKHKTDNILLEDFLDVLNTDDIIQNDEAVSDEPLFMFRVMTYTMS